MEMGTGKERISFRMRYFNRSDIKRRISRIDQNRGTTMVELLVAVIIILMMVTMFAASVGQASQFLSKAYEFQDQVTAFNTEYYKKSAFEKRGDASTYCATKVSLKLDRERTDIINGIADSVELPHLRVQKYTVTEEGLAKGMAMFSYQVEKQASEENP